jgi:DNA-binding NtrC family response regulator
MVVDSEAIICMKDVDVVKHAGYEVIDVSNADTAIEIPHSRNDICAVFADISIPGSMNGMLLRIIFVSTGRRFA